VTTIGYDSASVSAEADVPTSPSKPAPAQAVKPSLPGADDAERLVQQIERAAGPDEEAQADAEQGIGMSLEDALSLFETGPEWEDENAQH
jgi:hypothetical protein